MSIETPNPADIGALALARRSGWPTELKALLARYPREQWQGHANLGEMARFWLSRHAMFRELASMIQTIETQFHEGALPPAEFPRQFVPRLQFLLSQLGVHHQIEDLHYFPIFRAADARLSRGFDVLEADHHAIHADMANVAAHPATKRWWALTDPCQEPWTTRAPGEWWARMEPVFLME